MATITGIKAGTTRITATYGGKSAYVDITVSATAPTLSFTVNTANLTYNGSAQKLGTVTYNGDGTAYYFISTSNTPPAVGASGWTQVPLNNEITYTNAGSYYVHLKSTAGPGYSAVSPKLGNNDAKVIAQRTVTITAPTYNSAELEYNGSAQTITSGGSCTTGGEMYYYISTSSTGPTVPQGSAPGTGWSTTKPVKKTNAGTYYVWYYCYVSDTGNNKGTGINVVKSVGVNNEGKAIAKRTVTYTAPIVINHTYNGSAQTIFEPGECTPGGEMYYSDTGESFSTSTWSTTIPTPQQTNANKYRLYYYVLSDLNNNTGTGLKEIKYVEATILKKSTSAPALTAGGNSVYTNTTYYAKAANVAGNPAGRIYYGDNSGDRDYYIEVNAGATTPVNMTDMGRSDVGTTEIYAFFVPNDNDSINYEPSVASYTTVTISGKANGYATADTTDTFTYNGSAQQIATAVSNSGDYYFGLGSSKTTAPTTWGTKNTVLSRTNAGTYYVWMKADASTNYSAVGAKWVKTVTINQRTVTVNAPTAATGLTYNGSAQTIFTNAGSCSAGGKMYYSTSNVPFTPSSSSWQETIPYTKKTDAGTYIIYWYCYVSDPNDTGTGINTITPLSAIIGKASTSAPVLTPGSKTTYDGTFVYAKAASVAGNPEGKIYYGSNSNIKNDVSNSDSIDVGAGVTKAYNMTGMGRKSVGKSDIYAFFRPNSNNYAESEVVSTYVQVLNKANLNVTDVSYSGTYDGNEHLSTVTVNNNDWAGGTIVCGSSTSYGTTVTNDGDPGTAYPLKTATGYTAQTTVYYKISGDTNYNDYTGSVTFSIAKAACVLPTVWQGDAKDYDTANGIGTTASPASLTYSEPIGGTLKFRYDANGGTSWSTTTIPPTRTAVGNTSVQCMVEGDSNHTSTGWSETVTLTVNASTDAMMTITLPQQALTYTGTGQVIATGSGTHGISSYKIGYVKDSAAQPTADNQVTWASANNTTLSAVNAGVYYVYYSFTPDAGHSNSKEREPVGYVTISKAGRSGTVTFKRNSTTVTSVTIPNTVTAQVSGNSENGNVSWSVTNGTGAATVNSSGVVTPTRGGKVTVTASVDATDNYNAYTASAQLTIEKAQGTISYTPYNSVSEYCSRNPSPANKTDGAKVITIAASGATGATGAVSYGISINGWTISSDGKTITVPNQTPAGTYDITVSATSAETNTHLSKTVSEQITVNIIEQKLESIRLDIDDTTIPYNGTTTAHVIAIYTSTDYAEVTSDAGTTYTSDPDDVVTITK